MPYILHALRINAIALQIHFGMQLPLNQFKGFSQQVSDSIRRHSLLIGKKAKKPIYCHGKSFGEKHGIFTNNFLLNLTLVTEKHNHLCIHSHV